MKTKKALTAFLFCFGVIGIQGELPAEVTVTQSFNLGIIAYDSFSLDPFTTTAGFDMDINLTPAFSMTFEFFTIIAKKKIKRNALKRTNKMHQTWKNKGRRMQRKKALQI